MEKNEFDEQLKDYAFCRFGNENLVSLHKYAARYARRICGLESVARELYGENGWESPYAVLNESLYEDKNDWLALVERLGMSYKFTSTDKGDKFTLRIDGEHIFGFYPMCNLKYDDNASMLIQGSKVVKSPIEPVVVLYASGRGKVERIDKMYNLEYISNANGCDLRQYGWVNGEQEELMSELDRFVDGWGIRDELISRGLSLMATLRGQR